MIDRPDPGRYVHYKKGDEYTVIDVVRHSETQEWLVLYRAEYGVKDLYAGVPVIIGSGGVEKVVELDLNSEEKSSFEKSIQSVRDLFKDAQKIDNSL